MAGQVPPPPGTAGTGGTAGGSSPMRGMGGRRGGGEGGRPLPGQGGRLGELGGRIGGTGAGGYGGYGGSSPVVTCDYPAVTNDLVPWQQDDRQRTLEEAVARVAGGMAGDWRGFSSTPWVPPYAVTMSFNADGHYGGKCVWSSNECCEALYYGTDDDTPLKRYSLDSVTTTGEVNGRIDIIYGSPTVPYYESGYQGTLQNAQLDATGNRLRFDFIYGGEYGPLHYDLQRVSSP